MNVTCASCGLQYDNVKSSWNCPHKPFASVKIAETTDLKTEQFRTYATKKKYKNAVEGFNDLSPVPDNPIYLDERRELHVREWAPVGNEESIIGKVDIAIKGYITLRGDERYANNQNQSANESSDD